jgi:hypothetical protein
VIDVLISIVQSIIKALEDEQSEDALMAIEEEAAKARARIKFAKQGGT